MVMICLLAISIWLTSGQLAIGLVCWSQATAAASDSCDDRAIVIDCPEGYVASWWLWPLIVLRWFWWPERQWSITAIDLISSSLLLFGTVFISGHHYHQHHHQHHQHQRKQHVVLTYWPQQATTTTFHMAQWWLHFSPLLSCLSSHLYHLIIWWWRVNSQECTHTIVVSQLPPTTSWQICALANSYSQSSITPAPINQSDNQPIGQDDASVEAAYQ